MREILDNFDLNERLFPLPLKSERKRYLLEKNEDYELVLMIWAPDSQSPIHDHGGSECWARLLKGQLSERTFFRESLKLISQADLNLNEITYTNEEEGIHQMINSTDEIAFTLHLYIKPLGLCNAYDESNRGWYKMDNHYDQYQGLSL